MDGLLGKYAGKKLDRFEKPKGLLNMAIDAAKEKATYAGGLLDPNSPISKDAQGWHKRTQAGLKDLIEGKDTPAADYGYAQLMNMAGNAPIGMTAWHGSPHKFDKFSLDKIGTGEGAQAYGHGLYLAESPEVAQTYKQSADWRQKTMDQMKYLVDGREVMPKGVDDGLLYHYRMSAPDLFDERIAHLQKQHQGSLDQAAYYAEQAKLGEDADRYARMAARSNETANRFAEELALAERLKSQKVEAATGNLYKTDIPDEAVARFLDWDKPLSQQAPEVKKLLGFSEKSADEINAAAEALFEEGNKRAGKAGGWMDYPDLKAKYDSLTSELDRVAPELTGEHFYRGTTPDNYLHQMLGGNEIFPTSSEELLQKGIPGIRYLDGGSRSAGQGSSNFVIFDPEMIRILERNGQATGAEAWKPGEWKGLLTP